MFFIFYKTKTDIVTSSVLTRRGKMYRDVNESSSYCLVPRLDEQGEAGRDL
jgi:hypothetical protein